MLAPKSTGDSQVPQLPSKTSFVLCEYWQHTEVLLHHPVTKQRTRKKIILKLYAHYSIKKSCNICGKLMQYTSKSCNAHMQRFFWYISITDLQTCKEFFRDLHSRLHQSDEDCTLSPRLLQLLSPFVSLPI